MSSNRGFSSHGVSSSRGFSPRVRDEASLPEFESRLLSTSSSRGFSPQGVSSIEAWSIFRRHRSAIVFSKVKIVVVSKFELIEEQNSVDKDTFEELDALKKVNIVSVVDIDL